MKPCSLYEVVEEGDIYRTWRDFYDVRSSPLRMQWVKELMRLLRIDEVSPEASYPGRMTGKIR